MEFLFSDLGYLSGGEEFEITISRSANVCLLDSYNFSRYQRMSDFNYYGGNYSRGTCRLKVPAPGKWYIVIDLGGDSGNIQYSIQEVVMNPVKENAYLPPFPDGTIVYYDEFSDGSVRLSSVVRNGMIRSSGHPTFNSVQELFRYCKNMNWSKL